MTPLTKQKIADVDSKNMFGLISDFPDHWQKAAQLTEDLNLSVDASRISNILIAGMGGSAIGGDLISAYAEDTLSVPVAVNRHYKLPSWVNEHTLFIASSYSGNTEETLATTYEALDRGAQAVAITSNGALLKLVQDRDLDYVKIPGGMPPRAALAYSFVPQYQIFRALGFIDDNDSHLRETHQMLEEQCQSYANVDENEALSLAEAIQGTLPLIYSDGKFMAPINRRWNTQFEENAKTLCYGNVLPEMNHNEIVGWENIAHLAGRISVIFLHDQEDDERIEKRMEITRELVEDRADSVHTFHTRGRSRLTRMFSLIQLGDWTSLYLALITDTDPTPIARIDLLKRKLAEA